MAGRLGGSSKARGNAARHAADIFGVPDPTAAAGKPMQEVEYTSWLRLVAMAEYPVCAWQVILASWQASL